MSNLNNKRLNEMLKLIASSLNTLGLLGLVSGGIVPYITTSGSPAWGWVPAWVILHIFALLVLNCMQPED